jgi:hypothetical protein
MPRITKVKIKTAESTPTPDSVEVFNIEVVRAPFHVRGLSTMLVNNFSEKSRRQLEDESTGVAIKKKRGSEGKAARVPEEEFENARIIDPETGRDCVPARWIKAACISAATIADTGLTAKLVRQSIFVRGDLAGGELVSILGPNGKPALPRMQGDMVRRGRFGAKVPMMAYRAAFDPGWQLKFTVDFEPRLISHDKLIHLVRRTGLSIGLCEWRPEKNGECGRFDLATVGVHAQNAA